MANIDKGYKAVQGRIRAMVKHMSLPQGTDGERAWLEHLNGFVRQIAHGLTSLDVADLVPPEQRFDQVARTRLVGNAKLSQTVAPDEHHELVVVHLWKRGRLWYPDARGSTLSMLDPSVGLPAFSATAAGGDLAGLPGSTHCPPVSC